MISLSVHCFFILCVTKKMNSFHLFRQYFDLFLVFPSSIMDGPFGIYNLIIVWRCLELGATYFGRVQRPNIVPFVFFFLFTTLIFRLKLHRLLFSILFFAKKIFKRERHVFEDYLPVLPSPEMVPHACFLIEVSIGYESDIGLDQYVFETF
jgi:hypothetical protein